MKRSFMVGPTREVVLTITLNNKGEAILDIEGEAPMQCHCASTHVMTFEAQLRLTTEIDKVNMDDLEAAIRGDEQAALRLGWRMLTMLFNRATPPCQESSSVVPHA